MNILDSAIGSLFLLIADAIRALGIRSFDELVWMDQGNQPPLGTFWPHEWSALMGWYWTFAAVALFPGLVNAVIAAYGLRIVVASGDSQARVRLYNVLSGLVGMVVLILFTPFLMQHLLGLNAALVDLVASRLGDARQFFADPMQIPDQVGSKTLAGAMHLILVGVELMLNFLYVIRKVVIGASLVLLPLAGWALVFRRTYTPLLLLLSELVSNTFMQTSHAITIAVLVALVLRPESQTPWWILIFVPTMLPLVSSFLRRLLTGYLNFLGVNEERWASWGALGIGAMLGVAQAGGGILTAASGARAAAAMFGGGVAGGIGGAGGVGPGPVGGGGGFGGSGGDLSSGLSGGGNGLTPGGFPAGFPRGAGSAGTALGSGAAWSGGAAALSNLGWMLRRGGPGVSGSQASLAQGGETVGGHLGVASAGGPGMGRHPVGTGGGAMGAPPAGGTVNIPLARQGTGAAPSRQGWSEGASQGGNGTAAPQWTQNRRSGGNVIALGEEAPTAPVLDTPMARRSSGLYAPADLPADSPPDLPAGTGAAVGSVPDVGAGPGSTAGVGAETSLSPRQAAGVRGPRPMTGPGGTALRVAEVAVKSSALVSAALVGAGMATYGGPFLAYGAVDAGRAAGDVAWETPRRIVGASRGVLARAREGKAMQARDDAERKRVAANPDVFG